MTAPDDAHGGPGAAGRSARVLEAAAARFDDDRVRGVSLHLAREFANAADTAVLLPDQAVAVVARTSAALVADLLDYLRRNAGASADWTDRPAVQSACDALTAAAVDHILREDAARAPANANASDEAKGEAQ